MDNTTLILLIAFGAVILLALIIWLSQMASKRRQIKKTGIDEEKGVRYTAESDITKNDEEQNISFIKEDIIIPQNITEVAGAKNKVKCGKYTVLSTIEGIESFYVRIGSYVRGMKHGSEIVLTEGERITPVSCSIILR